MSYFTNQATVPRLPVEIHFEILKYVVNFEHAEQDLGAQGDADDESDADDEDGAENDDDVDDESNEDGENNEEDDDDDDDDEGNAEDNDDEGDAEDDDAEGDTDDEGDFDNESDGNDPQESVPVAQSIYQENFDSEDELDGEPITGVEYVELIKHDTHTLFSRSPYNYAAVCHMWLSILKKFPKCWREVSIDIASDPKMFLDIFLWSKDLDKLKVTVINSHTPDPLDANYKWLERERVFAIVNALRPHISRCESITFQVALFTSLPSPVIFLLKDAPYLIDLNLECRIDNIPSVYSAHCDIGIRGPIRGCASFPSLKRLSMTGFWFMFLVGHAYTAKWLKELRGNNDTKQRIAYDISHFQFEDWGQYSLESFVMYCSKLHPSTLGLHHLSLNHNGPVLERSRLGSERATFAIKRSGPSTIFLENVAPNVLETLFFLDKMSPDCLVIHKCTLPDVVLPSRANKLILEELYNTPPLTFNRILEEWKGMSLIVDSCPFFDDTSLSVLAKCSNRTPRYLEIFDCKSFTVPALRKFCEARNQPSIDGRNIRKTRPDYCPVIWVNIYGDCPFLSQEDQEWFETSLHARPIQVNWSCMDPENPGVVQEFNKGEHKSFVDGVRVHRSN